MTGYSGDNDQRRPQEFGFYRHLVKPVRPEHLSELLADIAKR